MFTLSIYWASIFALLHLFAANIKDTDSKYRWLMIESCYRLSGPIMLGGYDGAMQGTITNNEHTITFSYDSGLQPYIYGGRLPAGDRYTESQSRRCCIIYCNAVSVQNLLV